MSVLLGFLQNRFSAPSLQSLSPAIITNKTIIVTGASSGLGLEAARHYIHLGASRVILAVRSPSKGDEARRQILSSFPPDKALGSIDVWKLDLSSFASVQAFAKRATQELNTLDIAVLNAAVAKNHFSRTDDGWEESIQVNHLSNTLLALLLLPKMKQSATKDWKPRLTIVGSRGHQYVSEGEAWQTAPNILETLNGETHFGRLGHRYGLSKLLITYGAREIAKTATVKDGSCDVVVNYCCPGACKSDLQRDIDGFWQKAALGAVYMTICKTTEEGARTLVYASCLGEESHGRWIHNDRIKEYVCHECLMN